MIRLLLAAAWLFAAARSLATSSPSFVQKALLKSGRGKSLREEVVGRYFDGVNKKDAEQIASCFGSDGARIRDVCGPSGVEREASRDQLADRCMEFLAAHPDARVDFHYGPTCGGGRGDRWVFAHWYETGTWSGESCGIDPEGTPLAVEGQTRFEVSDDLKIIRMVVTRTFSDWEKKL
uniref:SnoaL-like domain-containing protein n=1 Tax=Odontella aurita TaxID=265563 RepID=A0A7S4JJF8_9STRA|mmetsp:Transcript_47106/g.142648  ORF Transcript_47106/g.142648 Transcript_47106/m.142648 type:complete len:178 (+) Transcript_47106:101-634(+)